MIFTESYFKPECLIILKGTFRNAFLIFFNRIENKKSTKIFLLDFFACSNKF